MLIPYALVLTDEILAEYGAEMTWDIKAGLMGKRTSPRYPHHRHICD